MNYRKVISTAFFSILIAACNHPIEIIGDGDVTSASGIRNCYLEDFKAGADNCAKNTVVGAYAETYYATPRDGWSFDKWEGCQSPVSNACSFTVPAETVRKAWGTTAPAIKAYFRSQNPTSNADFLYLASLRGTWIKVDPVTGMAEVKGGLGLNTTTVEIVNDEIYVAIGSSIYKFTPPAYPQTFIGTSADGLQYLPLASYNGKLYSLGSYQLREIDKQTGFGRFIGELRWSSLPPSATELTAYAHGAAFDANGTLYVIGNGERVKHLGIVDLSSGNVTYIGDIGYEVTGLAFTKYGLHGVTSGGGLILINTQTGKGSQYASINVGDGKNYSPYGFGMTSR